MIESGGLGILCKASQKARTIKTGRTELHTDKHAQLKIELNRSAASSVFIFQGNCCRHSGLMSTFWILQEFPLATSICSCTSLPLGKTTLASLG